MVDRLTGGIVAIMTAGAIALYIAVVKDNSLKIIDDVTKAAIVAGRQVAIDFSRRHNRVVTDIAIKTDIGMIVGSIRQQLEKTAGIVAVVAFKNRFHML